MSPTRYPLVFSETFVESQVVFPLTKTFLIDATNNHQSRAIRLRFRNEFSWLKFPDLDDVLFDLLLPPGDSFSLQAIMDTSVLDLASSLSNPPIALQYFEWQFVDSGVEPDGEVSVEFQLTPSSILITPLEVDETYEVDALDVQTIFFGLYAFSCGEDISFTVETIGSHGDWFLLKDEPIAETLEISTGKPGTWQVEINPRTDLGMIASNVPYEVSLRVNLTIGSGSDNSSISQELPLKFRAYEKCSPGFASVSGDTLGVCTPCPLNTYNPDVGQTSCLPCPDDAPTTENVGSVSELLCSSRGGTFSYSDEDGHFVVLKCPEGSECSENEFGITLETLPLLPGWWRATEKSQKLRPCPHENFCVGGTDASSGYCIPYHKGPLCEQCLEGFVRRGVNNTCQECTNENSSADRRKFVGAVLGLLVVVVVTTIGLLMWTVRKYASKTAGVSSSLTSYDRVFRSLKLVVKGKIVVGQFQVVVATVDNFPFQYPTVMHKIANFMSVFAIDIFGFIDVGCLLPNGTNHFVSLVLVTIAPFVLIALIVATHFATKRKLSPEKREASNIVTWTMILLLLFLIYPAVSAIVLRTFVCDTFLDGSRSMRADYSIDCDTPQYRTFFGYAVFMTLVYPIGVVLLYFTVLWNVRSNLNPTRQRRNWVDLPDRIALAKRANDPIAQRSRFLWDPYQPRYYWFETFELVRKLVQVSMVVFFFDTSAMQIVLQVGMTVFFLSLLYWFRPYVEMPNQTLAVVAQWSLLIIAFVGLMNKLDIDEADADAYGWNTQALLDFLVVAAAIMPLLLAAAQIPIELHTDGTWLVICGRCFPEKAAEWRAQLEKDALNAKELFDADPAGLRAMVAEKDAALVERDAVIAKLLDS